MKNPPKTKWRFCLDRGGTFTDIVSLTPDGRLLMDKTPSDSVQGGLQIIRRHLNLPPKARIPADKVADIRIGTTISTNTLLEKKGARTALLVTRGYRDILIIGNQTRPQLFALDIHRPVPLYHTVKEIDERIDATGAIVQPLNKKQLHKTLTTLRQKYNHLAIAFMHASQHPAHEAAAAAAARQCGFTNVIASHEVSALMKYIPRAHTAVAEAYLISGLRQYISAITDQCEAGVEVLFMQSNGALAGADTLAAVNTILSGPAGGVVGMRKSAKQAGYKRAVGFDMGGTSTDVSITDGEEEGGDALRLENTVAGAPLFVPMLDIHTVASGGGSIVHLTDGRLQVGPQSAGAHPGPACYRNGGPLTITDCNVLLGKLPVEHFPAIFGKNRDKPPDAAVVQQLFNALSAEAGVPPPQLAEEFIRIAVEQMAGAIRRLATARAVDLSNCVLNSYGGAAGQHACLVAEAVGIDTVLVPKQASVLSAWGIGAADIGALKNRSVECPLDAPQLPAVFKALTQAAIADLPAGAAGEGRADSQSDSPQITHLLRCRYAGVDAELPIRWRGSTDKTDAADAAAMRADFEAQHLARYGYIAADKEVHAAVAEVQAVAPQTPPPPATAAPSTTQTQTQAEQRQVQFSGKPHKTEFHTWDALPAQAVINAPAVIIDALNTIVVEPGWRARRLENSALLLERVAEQQQKQQPKQAQQQQRSTAAMIAIMNSRFTYIAEQMGELLQQTAMSVNIRERLDFSCALFDSSGNLVANAPHIPVHLGSMSESVRHLHRTKPAGWERGDTYLLNSPYHGGTHLPDLTVIRPGRFDNSTGAPEYYVAARGHHSDIGGISPGSMPAASSHINEEGVLFELTPIVINGAFAEQKVRQQLAAAHHPARTPDENISDLRAQIAAVAGGVGEMQRTGEEFGAALVRRYLRRVQQNAEQAAKQLLRTLQNGESSIEFDDGSRIAVAIHIDKTAGKATFDFSGTSPQHKKNYNAPTAVVRAAVIYCLRVLLGDHIPLNDGLLRPVRLRLPRGSMLNPRFPAAVAAGNVEVSQNIVDAILAALGACANAQGTCNNLTIGAGGKQYYETICGGMGATPTSHGADAVQVHMTNSRASDPEVLEWHYPIRLETFAIRKNSGGKADKASSGNNGGNGAIRRLRLLTDGEANLLTSRRQQPPRGIAGGGNGKRGINHIERADGTVQPLAGCDRATLKAGDIIEIKTPGGGGFGGSGNR